MKKQVIWIIAIISVIVLGVILACNISKEETKPAISEKAGNKEKENKVENNVENKVEKNEVENVIEEDDTDEYLVEDKNTVEEPKTDLEKAIDIVKKDWGTEDGVYFAQDGQTQNGEYIICVRDDNTTAALAWYTVNVETGTFEKE